MPVTLTEWVGLLRSEYLAEFIPSGGAAVKIAVAPPEHGAAALDAVAAEARAQGYLVARVDAAQTRVHMIDRVFYTVARQVEWDRVTDDYLRALLRQHGIVVPEECPLPDLDAIAAANGRLKPDLYGEINRLITNG